MASKDGELEYKPIGQQKDYSAIRYLHYYADDCYIDIMQSGMFEMYHVDTAARITGESMDDYKFAWRPQFSGNVTASYQIGQDSLDGAAYRLDGRETVKLASEHLSQDFVFEVKKADLRYVCYTDYDPEKGYSMTHIRPVWQSSCSYSHVYYRKYRIMMACNFRMPGGVQAVCPKFQNNCGRGQ